MKASKRDAAYGFLVSARRRTARRAGRERFRRAKRGARGATYPWFRACGSPLAAGACVGGERVGGRRGTCQRGSQKPRHSEGASRSRSARESTRRGPTHRLKHAASLSLFLGQHPFQLSLLLHELLPQTQELLLLRGGALLRRLGVGARHLGTRNAPLAKKKDVESPAAGGRFSRSRRPLPTARPRSAS
jgi:hypothetical protein